MVPQRTFQLTPNQAPTTAIEKAAMASQKGDVSMDDVTPSRVTAMPALQGLGLTMKWKGDLIKTARSLQPFFIPPLFHRFCHGQAFPIAETRSFLIAGSA